MGQDTVTLPRFLDSLVYDMPQTVSTCRRLESGLDEYNLDIKAKLIGIAPPNSGLIEMSWTYRTIPFEVDICGSFVHYTVGVEPNAIMNDENEMIDDALLGLKLIMDGI